MIVRSSERSTGGLGVRFLGPVEDEPHSPLPWNNSDGGRVVGRTPLTLQLDNVPERQALDIILR